MKKNKLMSGILGALVILSLTYAPNSQADQVESKFDQVDFYSNSEQMPMAVMCSHGLFFYTVFGLSGGGCSPTRCDKPIE